MKRKALIGLAPVAMLLASCGDQAASLDDLTRPEPTPATTVAPETTTPVTLSDDIDVLIIDRLWAQKGPGICDAFNEALDTGVLTRDEIITFSMSYVDELEPAQKARLRDLIHRHLLSPIPHPPTS